MLDEKDKQILLKFAGYKEIKSSLGIVYYSSPDGDMTEVSSLDWQKKYIWAKLLADKRVDCFLIDATMVDILLDGPYNKDEGGANSYDVAATNSDLGVASAIACAKVIRALYGKKN